MRLVLMGSALVITVAAVGVAAFGMNRLVDDLQDAAEHQAKLSQVQRQVMALSYGMTDAVERAVEGDRAFPVSAVMPVPAGTAPVSLAAQRAALRARTAQTRAQRQR